MSKDSIKYSNLKKKKKFLKDININKWNSIILRSNNFTFLTKQTFESIRRYVSRKFKKKIKFSIYKFTHKIPLTKKSIKSRMGKGKGKIYKWFWSLNKNSKLIELSYFKRKKLIFFFLKKVKKKLPIKLFFLSF